jgi:hypothetical protein
MVTTVVLQWLPLHGLGVQAPVTANHETSLFLLSHVCLGMLVRLRFVSLSLWSQMNCLAAGNTVPGSN